IDRKIRALLNKLTLDNFDDVSDDLLKWGNKSAAETDGRILRHLIMLVFQKATDEPTWASMYARLCHKLMTQTNPDVEDHSLMTKEGKFLSGGYLVRKYLLTKCQEDFERGWKVDMPEDLESEEYYEAAKIKRRGLGLVKFIGELFLLDMLTERIMHECVKRLLSNVETPEEEETESLAKLITTVGKKLDRDQAKSYMDAYFQRIDTMAKNKKLNSRIRFMLRDVMDLRAAKWVNRTKADGPKTIA
ncbi:ARM repeat-containing protein, partial [Linderina pennispora]